MGRLLIHTLYFFSVLSLFLSVKREGHLTCVSLTQKNSDVGARCVLLHVVFCLCFYTAVAVSMWDGMEMRRLQSGSSDFPWFRERDSSRGNWTSWSQISLSMKVCVYYNFFFGRRWVFLGKLAGTLQASWDCGGGLTTVGQTWQSSVRANMSLTNMMTKCLHISFRAFFWQLLFKLNGLGEYIIILLEM